MSHVKERKEKTCLNCSTEVTGRFCQKCGQENIEPRETFWGLIAHFFNDITHFDGKFFSSLKFLISKPGFLPAEFIKGRRATYLNPIRMYVFTSALFFLIFYSKFTPKMDPDAIRESFLEFNKEKLDEFRKNAYEAATTRQDSLAIDSGFAFLKKIAIEKKDSTVTTTNLKIAGLNIKNSDLKSEYKTIAAYDSAQQQLPPQERHNWMLRMLNHRNIEIISKYGGNNQLFYTNLASKFIHLFPYMLFVSLPLYALFLKLLYIRRKRFFVEHIIWLIYLYIFTFIVLLLYFLMDAMKKNWHWELLGYVQFIMGLAGVYYAYKAMRKYYEQRRAKTIFKFVIFNFLCFISLLFIFIMFLGISVFQV